MVGRPTAPPLPLARDPPTPAPAVLLAGGLKLQAATTTMVEKTTSVRCVRMSNPPDRRRL
jgi:hypothetical protein